MIKNGVINLIGQLVKVSSSVLIIPYIIKFLGLETFGLLSWSTAVLAAMQLAEGGLSAGLLYFLSNIELNNESLDVKKRRDQLLTANLILLAGSVLIVITALWTTSSFLVSTIGTISPRKSTELIIVLKVGAILCGLRLVQNLFWSVLQSQQLYKTYSVLSALQTLIINLIWALLAYQSQEYLPNYIVVNILVTLTFTILLFNQIQKKISSFSFSMNFSILKSVFDYNLGIAGTNLGSILFAQGDKIIIASVLGPSLLGVYSIFTNIVTQLNTIVAQAVHPILPLVSSFQNNLHKGNLEKTKQSVAKSFLLNVYISMGGCGCFIILAEPILKFFLGTNFSFSFVFSFQLLSYIYGIYTLGVTGYYLMFGLGKSKKVMIIVLTSSIGVLISMYVLSTSSSLIGAVISNCLFALILLLLVEGMNIMEIPFKSWFALTIIPLVITTCFFIIVFIFTIEIHESILMLVTFLIVMTYSFYCEYLKLGKLNTLKYH